MTELFSNLGQTSINQIGGIGATDTTVVVASLNGTNPANAFPSSGNFRLVFGNDLNSEIALCTAVNSTTNTLTIVRGLEGTTAQAWVNGSPVAQILTAQAINQMRAEVFSVGPYSARQPQGLPTGSYYQTTDGHTPWVWDPTTGIWRPFITGTLGFQPPPTSLFSTSVNTPGTLVDTGFGALDCNAPSDAAGSIQFRGFTFSFTVPGFIETCIQHFPKISQAANSWVGLGPCFRESSSGKIYMFAHSLGLGTANVTEYMETSIYSSVTVRTSAPLTNIPFLNGPLFLRIRWDNANVVSEFSRDRIRWTVQNTSTLASIFTSKPDQFGFGGFSANNAGTVRILSFNYGPTYSAIINAVQPPRPPPTIFTPFIGGYITPTLNH